MLVKVVPIRPIPGILPKNKWIDDEIILDLNKNEIVHCMNYGNVYDEDGNIIDAISVHKKAINQNKPKAVEVIKPVEVEPVIVKEVPEIIIPEPVKEVAIMGPITVIPVEEEPVIEPVIEESVEEPYFKLEMISCVKEDDHIILETQMNTNSKLEGSLYGLFNVTSGTRPMVEFKTASGWNKVNNKFADFNEILNEDKLTFRLTPKNENEFAYKILIKHASEVLVSLEEKINPEKL